ncbi:carboxypeptidase-like regulatory domain-containing protein [Formosa sp. S-31]|uniref:carboxypeptidase-like regulatory domain-containing protein n=1 Tax=Formosa sp. S-31 TaxID=2790949 RepID=UPI003EBD70D2
MRKTILAVLLFIYVIPCVYGQLPNLSGSVKDGMTLSGIADVSITIENTDFKVLTDSEGGFRFRNPIPAGEWVLVISKLGYLTKRFPIVLTEGNTLIIQDMLLMQDLDLKSDVYTIILSDDELQEDSNAADNISGLLQAGLDVFQRTAAFEFSPSFYKIKGLDSSEGSVLINGVTMNSFQNGRPQWNNWGGINDMLRNQELNYGIAPSAVNFGGVLGTRSINTRASEYRKGGRVTYSAANRSYTNRVMASYATGLSKAGWALALCLGRRWGAEGYLDATFYDANSFFISVEKKVSAQHSINFTGIYTPNKRGKSSPNTQEVYDLKDIRYNEYWGYQDGEKRNSRVKQIAEPMAIFSHYWTINTRTTLQTNLSYKFGKQTNSRLDYPGGANPSPSYYQKLPSYFLAQNEPDYAKAYQAEQDFIENGQINWNRIYDANITNASSGLSAAYILYDDRIDDQVFSANTLLNTEINDRILINSAFNYRQLRSDNYGELTDLLGAENYLHVDPFDGWQYDLLKPDRLLNEGDKMKYHYIFKARTMSGFGQIQMRFRAVDYFLAVNLSQTHYQREGVFQHEAFAESSLGKSDALDFFGFGVKGGLTYKISGKHIFQLKSAFVQQPPGLQNSFSNPRENNAIVKQLTEAHQLVLEGSYTYRSPVIKAKILGYYIQQKNKNEIGFYYADGLTSAGIQFNETSAFVQEVLHGVNTLHFGFEYGVDFQLTSTFKLKAAGSFGQFIYNNTPELYLTSSSFVTQDGAIDFGAVQLKNYRLANGPQGAFSFGFEYRDPDYWWFGASGNVFTNTYLDVSPLSRTSNFYLDDDGLPFNDYDEEIAKQLLKQERFNNYLVVNLIGGKSWRIKKYYLGLFLSVNNILDKLYKTGGFEQGRNANYAELKADVSHPKRVFAPKYWYGRGASYFANINLRF